MGDQTLAESAHNKSNRVDFGTIRHRTKRSKGCLSHDGMLHMIFKLGLCAEQKWRRLRGYHSLGQVIANVKFKDGFKKTEEKQKAA